MNTKLISVMVAILMIATAASFVIGTDADADTPDGSVAVSFKGQGASTFTTTTVVAYDAYQAVIAADATLGFTAAATTDNAKWNVQEGSGSSTYYNPNVDYGTLSTITESSTTNSISSYHIYVYTTKTTSVTSNGTTTSTSTTGWFEPSSASTSALGWIHPYADYSAYITDDSASTTNTTITYSLASANIAISYGEATAAQLNSISRTNTTTIAQYTDAYQYSFTISGTGLKAFSGVSVIIQDEDGEFTTGTLSTYVPSGTNVVTLDAVTIYGWGSNAFEALKNALGASNVVGQGEDQTLRTSSSGSTYYTYYSWMDTILGSGTESSFTSSSSTYSYWSSYIGSDYCDYTLGYYSGISGAYNSASNFVLTYVTSTYYY